jgi:hypothetical protein
MIPQTGIQNFVSSPSVIKPADKSRIMLHQISWFSYGSAIAILATAYYGYVGLTFYLSELRATIYRLTGKKPPVARLSGGDFQIQDYDPAGPIKQESVAFVPREELMFGPPEESEVPVMRIPATPAANDAPDVRLAGDFSEMIAEVKTLIRVINESSESKENFEMLFRLIIQKYQSLSGTSYEDQVNDFLINEGAGQFPFPLTLTELQNYWINQDIKN